MRWVCVCLFFDAHSIIMSMFRACMNWLELNKSNHYVRQMVLRATYLTKKRINFLTFVKVVITAQQRKQSNLLDYEHMWYFQNEKKIIKFIEKRILQQHFNKFITSKPADINRNIYICVCVCDIASDSTLRLNES